MMQTDFRTPPSPSTDDNRRRTAPHPGPIIRAAYLDPLALDAASLAPQIRMDPARLQRMLAGEESIDVDTAVRLGRSLQISPQFIMERQIAHDFNARRTDGSLDWVPVVKNDGRTRFPERGFVRGSLAGLRQSWGYGEVRPETLSFFADETESERDPLARMHDIALGSRLRVYDPSGRIVWIGVVLQTFEGDPLLPFVRPGTWIEWFVNRWRADFVAPQLGAR